MTMARRTVDLTKFQDLIVIYLGMRVNSISGIKTVIGIGPKISRSVAACPEGLLLHEPLLFSLFPLHIGMRQYWRDFESLEAWARSDPHRAWWNQFFRDTGGTGIWHETYFMRGGMEALYGNMVEETGFLRFAPVAAAKGPMFSARGRLHHLREPTKPELTSEEAFEK